MLNPSTTRPSTGVATAEIVSATTDRAFDRPFARISWGSVLAGAIIALASQIVLTLIGVSIGLATLDPTTGDSPSGAALGAGAGIWLVLSSLLSLFFGGYIAARLGGTFNGWLHGLTTWGCVTLLTLMFLTSAAGRLIGTASGLADFAVSNSGKASQASLPPAIQQQVDQLKAQASTTADQAAAQAQSTDPATRDAQARQVGEKAATGGAVGSGAAAFGMILGAVAAAFGGKLGQRHPLRDDFDRADRVDTASGRERSRVED